MEFINDKLLLINFTLQSNIRGLFVPVVFDVEFNVTTSGSTACTVACPVVNKFDPNNDDPFAKARKYSVSQSTPLTQFKLEIL